ncbi:hypothetical protein SAMN04488550_2573 [Gordonia malaquae]|uniref:HicB-like antitoxin of toxin-antitoxin system domain-containing protein n=1 Tax=Gordonia malaquae NBRC 108250 TaxID=1223542 RepID=M3VHB5_GORML|nr:hypothetical protein [Gordonia malaquae]GAC81764.1 hypothetical protein GM1_044_00120 [Gordonia malaquae NBRC 108250]SED47098.1 hypothetical protein SAMN04488550_2573 [Gordonia malaquae]
MTTYRLDVYRDDRWWMIRIPQLDGVNGHDEGLTQARTYGDIETEARDYITLVADVAPSTIDLDVHVTIDDLDVTAAEQRITASRKAAAVAEREALNDASATAYRLQKAGVSQRDIGEIIGVSYQRVGQILTK